MSQIFHIAPHHPVSRYSSVFVFSFLMYSFLPFLSTLFHIDLYVFGVSALPVLRAHLKNLFHFWITLLLNEHFESVLINVHQLRLLFDANSFPCSVSYFLPERSSVEDVAYLLQSLAVSKICGPDGTSSIGCWSHCTGHLDHMWTTKLFYLSTFRPLLGKTSRVHNYVIANGATFDSSHVS